MAYEGKETDAYFENGEPKFPFVGQIVEAYYTDPELKHICIVYNYKVPEDGVHTDRDGNPNGGQIDTTVYNIMIEDKEDARLLALLEEFSWEAIDECTRARHENHRQEFRDALHRYATENNMYGHGLDAISRDETQGSLDILFNYDPDNSEHKEALFKLKLRMFETPEVKDSRKKKAKAEIRKSDTPVQAVKAFASFFK